MALGAGPGSCGKRVEKQKSDLIERTAHLLALQQLYHLLVDIFLHVGADVGRLGTESWLKSRKKKRQYYYII